MKRQESEDRLVRELRRDAAQRRRSPPNTRRALALMGTVGWSVVVPAFLGIAAGRYLDSRLGTGIYWTLSLLVLGVVLGCGIAWRHIQEAMK